MLELGKASISGGKDKQEKMEALAEKYLLKALLLVKKAQSRNRFGQQKDTERRDETARIKIVFDI